MEEQFKLPDGYLHFFPEDDIPEDWTVCDGKDGTPDLSKQPAVWGHGPMGTEGIVYPNHVWCIKGWKRFKDYYVKQVEKEFIHGRGK